MVGDGIAAALLACQMASQVASQAYREEERRQEEERIRRDNFCFMQRVPGYYATSVPCNCATACPNEFTTGMPI